MLNIQEVKLTNQKSFVNQKFNLLSNDTNEIFMIPTFTLILAPVVSAENITCYEIFFQVSYVYCKPVAKKAFANLENLLFQYDLNFSKESPARGQIKLFKAIKVILMPGEEISTSVLDTSILKKGQNLQYLKDVKLTIFKILLPVQALKKDGLNILHYSFNGEADLHPPFHSLEDNKYLHINNKNNSGTLSFYINKNPNYQLKLIPKILNREINILTIKNPLVFQTFIPIINKKYYLTLANNKLGVINGHSLVNECLNVIVNNLNSLSSMPLKIQYFLENNKNEIDWETNDILAKLNNFFIHQSEFNFQQDVVFNIIDNQNNIKSNKVKGTLTISNGESPNKEYMNFQQYYLQINNEVYSSVTNKIINEFPFPYTEKLNFLAEVLFKFETFFNYDVSFSIIEHSNSAIIGNENNLIMTSVDDRKNDEDKWVETNVICMSYEEIRQYYIGNNFNFNNYEELITERNNYVC